MGLFNEHAHYSPIFSSLFIIIMVESQNINSSASSPFPGYSEYQKACCGQIELPKIDSIFWGHWEVSLAMPIIVSLLSIGSYLYIILLIVPNLAKLGIYVGILGFFFLFLFLLTYFQTIYFGPGYFPFYWDWMVQGILPSQNVDDKILFDMYSGIITTPEQYYWAHSLSRPGRSVLSNSAKRYVLRPDHFCSWVSSWIGKRNFKFFFLFNLYGVLYLLYISISGIVGLINESPTSLLQVPHLFLSIIGIMFFGMTINFVTMSYTNAKAGITSWEKWNDIDFTAFDKGQDKNLEDAFGSSDCCQILLPIPAWNGISNHELSQDYQSYDVVKRKKNEQNPSV